MLTMRNMDRQMRLFTIATLTPAALLALGASLGGIWILLSVIYLTGFTTTLDRLIKRVSPNSEFPTGNGLSISLAIAHFCLMPLIIIALAGTAHSGIEKAGLYFAAGLFMGQVSNANAHELIHRGQRQLHRLGMWVYISMLFGHHTSAHVLVHHRHVATDADPNTARKGESFYRYALRAWAGSFIQGYRAEAARLIKSNRPALQNPYVVYVGGALIFITLAYFTGGIMAATAYVALAGYAQTQLLMSDYVQHYGLIRANDDSGKPQPVGPKHSWNSPHYFSSALMLNATRHSDHHAHPARAYPALTLPKDVPMLPKPLPLMASIALLPPLWRHMMDARVDRWQNA